MLIRLKLLKRESLMFERNILKKSIYISIFIIIVSLIIFQLLKPRLFDHSKKLDFTLQIISYKNGYTKNDFLNELKQINSAAYAMYESDYFVPFITTHLQRETILMLPMLRKNTDIEISNILQKTNHQFYFQLPSYSQEHSYPISYIDLNLPSIHGGISFDCKSKRPQQTSFIETENYKAQIIFNQKKCSIRPYS
nr:hypothetical protein [Acinetobacter courvalinii]